MKSEEDITTVVSLPATATTTRITTTLGEEESEGDQTVIRFNLKPGRREGSLVDGDEFCCIDMIAIQIDTQRFIPNADQKQNQKTMLACIQDIGICQCICCLAVKIVEVKCLSKTLDPLDLDNLIEKLKRVARKAIKDCISAFLKPKIKAECPPNDQMETKARTALKRYAKAHGLQVTRFDIVKSQFIPGQPI